MLIHSQSSNHRQSIIKAGWLRRTQRVGAGVHHHASFCGLGTQPGCGTMGLHEVRAQANGLEESARHCKVRNVCAKADCECKVQHIIAKILLPRILRSLCWSTEAFTLFKESSARSPLKFWTSHALFYLKILAVNLFPRSPTDIKNPISSPDKNELEASGVWNG